MHTAPPVRSCSRALAPLLLAASAVAQVPGSVVLLNRTGRPVDGHAYARKDAAYLSGGPEGSCLAAGLADGDWVFQVTDPAGTVLLTPEAPIERTVRVVNGRLDGYYGSLRPWSHLGPCGALNLRLAPFTTTPYPGGEYKVWLTRVEDYDAGGAHLFGFDPARSESDSFRVAGPGAQTLIRGHKFYDHDADGAWNPQADPLELAIGAWRVELWRDGVLDGVTFTDQDGGYVFVRDRDGSAWEVREQSPNGFVEDATAGATWRATTARSFVVTTGAEVVVAPPFGNVRYEVSAGAGRSVEWWSEGTGHDGAPGSTALQACDPQWRLALNEYHGLPVNLRKPVSNDNPNASIFTLRMPPQSFQGAFANWKSYAERTPHDHAGFLLSRQVAATLLSVSCGDLSGDVWIDRHQDGVLVPLDTMIVGVIGLLSQTGAGLTGPNDPYQDLRHMMQMCTNEFGSINNTGDPSSPQVVFSRSSESGKIHAPY